MEISTTNQQNVKFAPAVKNVYPEILTEEALVFLNALHEKFNDKRLALLERREKQQSVFDSGKFPSFPVETKEIRESDWTAAPIPEDLLDRRVEITGPVDRKMVINALNSGAKTFMADFEDSNAPSWANNIEGQINLRDANNKTIELRDEARGKYYKLKEMRQIQIRPHKYF